MPKRVPVPTGRPRTEPTPADLRKIEAWASKGCGPTAIAKALGVSYDLMKNWRERHPEVDKALEIGKSFEHEALLSKAMRLALDGDKLMLMFLLKTRHGYREGEQLQIGNRLNVTFNMPAAMPMDDFLRMSANVADTGIQRLPTQTARITRES